MPYGSATTRVARLSSQLKIYNYMKIETHINPTINMPGKSQKKEGIFVRIYI